MHSLLFENQLNNEDSATHLSNSLSLAPQGFFSKKMNISRKALENVFIFWKDALVSFLNGNYIVHDALVGENACHIRAYILMKIAYTKQENYYFQATLVSLVTELKRLLEKFKKISISVQDANNTVQDFLFKNNLIFSMPAQFIYDIKYIIDSFLLTLTKQSLPATRLTLHEKTSYQPVRDWGFSYNRAQYLVHNTQKELSALSCAYIKMEASLLDANPFSMLLDIKKDAHNRHFIPQFITAKIIFLRVLKQNHQILIKITRYLKNVAIDQMSLRFKPNKNQRDFELCTNHVEDRPCIVIAGVIDYLDIPESLEVYKKRLLSHSILDVCLANFAIHPQYSGELKDLPPPFDEIINNYQEKKDHSKKINLFAILREKEDFEIKKQYAKDKGCSLENPSLLFINHMYCDTPINHFSNYEREIFRVYVTPSSSAETSSSTLFL